MKSSFEEDELIDFFSGTDMKEALFISSSSLAEELIKYQNKEPFTEKRKEKLILSLLKYTLRIHNRCTPFGLFSGCTTIKFSDKSGVELNDVIKRRTHLDTSVICHIIQSINEIVSIADNLLFYPNNSILKVGDKIRYTEFSYIEDRRVYNVASVDNSFYLDKILEVSINGVIKTDLVNLISSLGVEMESAIEFIELLIQNQILVSELELSLTGEESLKAVINRFKSLKTAPEKEEVLDLLENVLQKLRVLDENQSNEIDMYSDLKHVVSLVTKDFDENHFVHIDTVIGCTENSSLDIHIQNQILSSIEILHRLNSYTEERNLREFITKFFQRYEDQEISLLTALDPEIGIGYGLTENRNSGIHPIVDDLFITENGNDNQEPLIKSNGQLIFLRRVLLDSLRFNKHSVDLLDEKEIMSFEKKNSLPLSFSVFFNLLRDEKGEDIIHLHHAGGSSAANILGRFTEDVEIGNLVTEIFERESLMEKNNSILAEIIHLPQDRIGNLTKRYKSREWEIPYLSRGSVDYDNQIQLNDIFVSVKNDKVVLRSKKHNTLVLPRLCNSHNFRNNSLPIYHFLCDLQFQGIVPGLSFSLNDLGLNLSFYPRITVGKVIVSRATWRLSESEISKVSKSADCEQEIQKLIKEINLPVTFFIVEGDNELLIDIRNRLSIALFISEIKNKHEVIIKEDLYQSMNSSIVHSKERKEFSNEFIASIINNSNTLESGVDTTDFLNRAKYNENSKDQRFFSPGSEWLYFKIYCGSHTSDEILSEVIRDIVIALREEELIKKWFFIRYSDPGNHLRIRFNLVSIEMFGRVMDIVNKHLKDRLESGIVWDFQLNTYKREIERYGDAMSVSEKLFYYDSEAIVEFLTVVNNYPENNLLIKFALQGIYDLMESFSFDVETKISMMQKLKANFFEEFGAGKALKKGLDKKIREYRVEMDNLRNKTLFTTEDVVNNILFDRKQNFCSILNELEEILLNGKSILSKEELTYSYIHMFMNRLFNGKQRLHELVAYYLLVQVYRTEQMISKSL